MNYKDLIITQNIIYEFLKNPEPKLSMHYFTPNFPDHRAEWCIYYNNKFITGFWLYTDFSIDTAIYHINHDVRLISLRNSLKDETNK